MGAEARDHPVEARILERQRFRLALLGQHVPEAALTRGMRHHGQHFRVTDHRPRPRRTKGAAAKDMWPPPQPRSSTRVPAPSSASMAAKWREILALRMDRARQIGFGARTELALHDSQPDYDRSFCHSRACGCIVRGAQHRAHRCFAAIHVDADTEDGFPARQDAFDIGDSLRARSGADRMLVVGDDIERKPECLVQGIDEAGERAVALPADALRSAPPPRSAR